MTNLFSTETKVADPLLITRKEVAHLLNCSDRHVARMDKEGLMPQPVRLRTRGVRYSRKVIEEWVDAGCPALAV
jgi:predicted DNA-binding transcriptional regulator AlpA